MNEVYDSKRRALYVAVAALCTEVGYTDAEKPALESLVEMMQSCRFLLASPAFLTDSHCLNRSSRDGGRSQCASVY